MNIKRKFKPTTPQSTYAVETTVQIKSTARKVTKPMELKLVVKPGRKPGRYRFEQVETKPDGTVLLHLYGPLGRSYASMRYVDPIDVVSVHKPAVTKMLKDDGTEE